MKRLVLGVMLGLLAGAGAGGCGVDPVERTDGTSGGSAGSAGSSGTSAGGTTSGGSGGSSGASGASMGGGASGGAAGGSAGSSGSAGGGGIASGGNGGAASSGGAGGSVQGFCGARPGLLFCEDFEDFAVGAVGAVTAATPWSAEVNGEGTVVIDDAEAHDGARSAKITGNGFSTFLVFHDAALLPAAGKRVYVRAFVRFAEPMSGGHNTFVIADRAEAPGTGNAFRLGEMNEMLMYTVSGDTHGALSNENFYNDHVIGAALTAGEFGCVEFVLDSAAPEIDVWLEGVEIPDLHHTDWPLDDYDALRFGFEKYAGPVREIWYDDIAIGTEPIGCH